MAKYVGYKRPKDTKKTLKRMLHYIGIHKWSMALVAVLICISSFANIFGTYLVACFWLFRQRRYGGIQLYFYDDLSKERGERSRPPIFPALCSEDIPASL